MFPLIKTRTPHVYEVRPREDHRGVNLISDALAYSPLWYAGPNAISNAVEYAKHRSRSRRAVIPVYDATGNVIGTHEQASDFKVCEARQTKSRHAVKRDG